jgi:hypothetical protein
VASSLNSGFSKDGTLLRTTCCLTLELFLSLSIPSFNKKEYIIGFNEIKPSGWGSSPHRRFAKTLKAELA